MCAMARGLGDAVALTPPTLWLQTTQPKFRPFKASQNIANLHPLPLPPLVPLAQMLNATTSKHCGTTACCVMVRAVTVMWRLCCDCAVAVVL